MASIISPTPRKVWDEFLARIKPQLTPQGYNTWFKPLKPLKLEGTTLTIQVPTPFVLEWLETHYLTLFNTTISAILGPQGKIACAVPVKKNTTSAVPNHTLSNQPILSKQAYIPLNPRYTFETLVSGHFNKVVIEAAKSIVKNPGTTSFNPFTIIAPIGYGKTHIVQAIGNALHNNYKVAYLSPTLLTNQFVEALKNNRVQDLLAQYNALDVLLIDDIQFLSGKAKTQEIFFQIFNQMHQANKQIVLTSDRLARDLCGLQERLLSRFKWGLTLTIEKPDLTNKEQIIGKLLEREDKQLLPSLIHYVANSVNTNIRELEGVLISILAHATLQNKSVDIDLVKYVLNNTVQHISTEASIDYFQKVVASHYHISKETLVGPSRKKEVALARHVAMYLCKKHTDKTLKVIGNAFGGRDHSTVLNSIKNIETMLDRDQLQYKAFQKAFHNFTKTLLLP